MNTAETIKSFLNLPKGWLYTRGVPFKQKTVDLALEIEEYARALQLDTEAFPGENGEIVLSIYPPKYQYPAVDNLDFEIETTGEIFFSKTVDDTYVEIGRPVEMYEVYKLIDQYAERDDDYSNA